MCKADIPVRGVSSFVDSSAGNRGWHMFRKIEERNTRSDKRQKINSNVSNKKIAYQMCCSFWTSQYVGP